MRVGIVLPKDAGPCAPALAGRHLRDAAGRRPAPVGGLTKSVGRSSRSPCGRSRCSRGPVRRPLPRRRPLTYRLRHSGYRCPRQMGELYRSRGSWARYDRSRVRRCSFGAAGSSHKHISISSFFEERTPSRRSSWTSSARRKSSDCRTRRVRLAVGSSPLPVGEAGLAGIDIWSPTDGGWSPPAGALRSRRVGSGSGCRAPAGSAASTTAEMRPSSPPCSLGPSMVGGAPSPLVGPSEP